VPSQLLERRPDIAATERLMAQANAQIGVATSAYYPTLTLSVAAGFDSNSLASWLTWPSRFWSVGSSWRRHCLTPPAPRNGAAVSGRL